MAPNWPRLAMASNVAQVDGWLGESVTDALGVCSVCANTTLENEASSPNAKAKVAQVDILERPRRHVGRYFMNRLSVQIRVIHCRDRPTIARKPPLS